MSAPLGIQGEKRVAIYKDRYAGREGTERVYTATLLYAFQ